MENLAKEFTIYVRVFHTVGLQANLTFVRASGKDIVTAKELLPSDRE